MDGQKQDVVVDAATHETKDKQKRRVWWRIVLWSLLGLFVLLLLCLSAVVIWLGPIVESYVEKHDKELVGRRMSMDNLSIKLFDGSVAVDNVVVYEADDADEFVRLGRAEVDIALGDIFDSHIHITRIALTSPSVAVHQDAESFNFDDMMAFITEEYLDDVEEDVDDEPSEWMVSIENISIDGAVVDYYDSVIDKQWLLSEVNVATPAVLLNGGNTHVTLATTINQQGSLAAAADVDLASLDFKVEGAVENFDISETLNYITPYANVSKVEGLTAVECLVEGNIEDIMAMTISGRLHVDNLLIEDGRGEKVFSAELLEATPQAVNIADDSYTLNTLIIDGYASRFVLNGDGSTNFSDLIYSDPEVSIETTAESLGDDMYDVKERVTLTTEDSVAPLRNVRLYIDTLKLSHGDLYFADHTMHEPFEYRLRDIAIDSRNFNFMGTNIISVRAKLPKQGSALFRWEGSMSDFYNQSLLAALTNVDMEGLSTYVEHYTAFPIESGNMTFRSQNVVSNGELSGVNQLGTYNFVVGKKDKSLDAEYNIPLKLGVYLLTDKDDHIDVDLPITGNIDSPEFSFRKVLWRALGNLLLKVAATPFSWMSADKQDTFRKIDIDLLVSGLSSEHYARLDAMAEALKQDSSLKVRLTQRINYSRAVQRIADRNLKIAYYNATEGSEKGYLDMLDFSKIDDMKLSGRAVADFADSLLVSRGIDPSHMSIKAKAMSLYGGMVDGQLKSLMTFRNNIIANYIAFQHADIPAGAFMISDVLLEDTRGYAGKDGYGVTLIIDDEEVEMEDAAAEEDVAEEDDDFGFVEDENSATQDNNMENMAFEGEPVDATEENTKE